ncbi:MAG TPA: hypothetical protein DEB35_11345, partial [Desulfuromonas sp.]|nr:hypothetical protein [Desulfuromonas sp.]
MLHGIKLRTKLLGPLLGLAIVPLLITLLVVSYLNQTQIGKAMDLRKTDITNFVERNTTYFQLEKFNYLTLIAQNEEVVSDVSNVIIGDSGDQLRQRLAELAKTYRFDTLEILDPAGYLVMRIAQDETIPATSTREHPVIQGSLEDDPMYDVAVFDGRLAIVTACPILVSGGIVGHIVGITYFNERMANLVKSASGAHIAFYHDGKIVAVTHKALTSLDPEAVRRGQTDHVDIEGLSQSLFVNSLKVSGAGVIVALDQTELAAAITTTRRVLWLLLISFGGLALVIGLVSSTRITRPLRRVMGTLEEMAAGGGDLTQTMAVESTDEMGELATNFNRFVAR